MIHGAKTLLGFAVALAILTSSLEVAAQSWPTKPVRMLLTFPPGGPSDMLTRVVSERLQAAFKQPFVVESRAGAGGNIGAEAVARSAPDGYTFGISTDTLFTVNPLVYRKMSFDPYKDLVPVTMLGSFSQMMVCNPSVPVKSLGELLQLAKREKLTYASGGPGVPGHLAAELLLSTTKLEMVHIPYKGPAQATTDMMGGQVQCGFLATPTVMPHVHAGKLTALAVSTSTRSPLAPQVPTAAEAGVAGFDATFYLVLFAPKGVPADIMSAMNREAIKALADPGVKERLKTADILTLGTSAEETAKTLRTIAAKWEPVIKRIDLKLE
jgi:tripartite-type tricarboxylate transporter receptor subunit TctC